MKRVFGVNKDKEPPPSVQDASDRIRRAPHGFDLHFGGKSINLNDTLSVGGRVCHSLNWDGENSECSRGSDSI